MLNQDYKDMLSILLESKVRFILVGAYAMAAHGFPRATGDMDIFIRSDQENAHRLYEALSVFGAPMSSIDPGDFEKRGTIFQIGIAPRRIDIINDIDSVEFDEADEDKIIIEIDGLKIPVISKQKLIINKESTGRVRDRLDAEKMRKSN
jgi:hypothetical protein